MYLEKSGIISPLISNFFPKKDPSIYEIPYRMAVDFRKIKCITSILILPDNRDSQNFLKLHEAKLFSTLDARSGYYITVAEDSRKYTMFTTEYGKYYFLLVFCFAYLHDTIIFSKLEMEYLAHL